MENSGSLMGLLVLQFWTFADTSEFLLSTHFLKHWWESNSVAAVERHSIKLSYNSAVLLLGCFTDILADVQNELLFITTHLCSKETTMKIFNRRLLQRNLFSQARKLCINVTYISCREKNRLGNKD